MASPWARPAFKGKGRDSSPFTPRQSLNYSLFLGDSAKRSQQRVPLNSQILEETDQHRVETFGFPLPVQISEALTSRDVTGDQHISVKISPFGWAWLVTGRKLFIWRYVPGAEAKGVFYKELILPASELYHMADLVCVMDCSGDVSGVSVMAVSPEGLVRYWPSLVNDTAVLDMETDLIGCQCHSLTALQPYGCILMTTTNELVLLSGSQKAINCQNLKSSSGVFSDLGRRVSSFIFGSQPASYKVANWQRVLASKALSDNSRAP